MLISGAALGHTTLWMAELVYGRIGATDLDRLINGRLPAMRMAASLSVHERARHWFDRAAA